MTGKAWKNGSTTAWRKVRWAVLERDGHRCQLEVDEQCEGVATHVHHTVGREVSGDDPRFLVAACPHCNYAIGDPRKHQPASSNSSEHSFSEFDNQKRPFFLDRQ